MGKYKRERKMKVYSQSGYKYKDTPTIIIKGAYLEELGFAAGTPIIVDCQGGKITITPANEVVVE